MEILRPLEEAMTLYKEQFIPAVRAGALLYLLPFTILYGLVLAIAYGLSLEPAPGLGGALILAMLVVAALMLFFSIWYSIAIIAAAYKKPPLQEGLAHIGRGILLTFIEIVVFGIIGLIITVPILLLWWFGMQKTLSMPSVILGCILLALVGFIVCAILIIYWSFGLIVLVKERTGPVAALKRSSKLVAGKFWWMALYLIIMWVISLAAGIVIMIVTLPFALLSLSADPLIPLIGEFMSNMLQTAIWVVVAPYLLFYLVKVYEEFLPRAGRGTRSRR